MAGRHHNFSGQAASDNARQHVGNNYTHNQHDGDNIYYTSNYNGTPTVTDPASQKRRNEALLEAAGKGHVQRLRALLKAGADVDYVRNNGLRYAYDRTTCDGWTALTIAVEKGFVEGVQMLIDAGSDIDHLTPSEATPLILAAGSKDSNILKILLDTPGIDLSLRTRTANAPIHFAAAYGRSHNVELLAQHESDVDLRNACGETPLHAAINMVASSLHGDDLLLETVQTLVRLGARGSLKDREGRTPAQLIESCKRTLDSDWKWDVYQKMQECLENAKM